MDQRILGNCQILANSQTTSRSHQMTAWTILTSQNCQNASEIAIQRSVGQIDVEALVELAHQVRSVLLPKHAVSTKLVKNHLAQPVPKTPFVNLIQQTL